MARFWGSIQGNRGEATRLGTPASGLEVRANGWDQGVKIFASVDATTGEDIHQIIQTGGSSGGGKEREIARIKGGKLYIDIWGDCQEEIDARKRR
jgi:hypothetical protein